jgi:hypothetical protein
MTSVVAHDSAGFEHFLPRRQSPELKALRSDVPQLIGDLLERALIRVPCDVALSSLYE